jgi:hypothetical protein
MNRRLNNDKTENIKKKNFDKKQKNEFLNIGESFIKSKAKKLIRHTERNKNTNHINHKVQHLLYDPFTFVNAYAKISKNRGALTVGHIDDNMMELFGEEKAKEIAKKIKKGEYEFKPVKRTWIPKPGKINTFILLFCY